MYCYSRGASEETVSISECFLINHERAVFRDLVEYRDII